MKTTPYVFCDFHGHSNRKNCFFFGCSAKKSWSKMDLAKRENAADFAVSRIKLNKTDRRRAGGEVNEFVR